MKSMMHEMIDVFKDPRYIKVNDGRCPVFIVYRAEQIPNVRDVVDEWRAIVRENGFEDLYLISMQHFKEIDPVELGFDAAAEFAAAHQNIQDALSEPFALSESALLSGMSIIPYERVVRYYADCERPKYDRYFCVNPGWDNSPRRGSNGIMIHGVTSKLFKRFFETVVRRTSQGEGGGHGFVFINAWNEWGEGAHLEPDVRNGYEFLNVIRSVIKGS